MANSVNNSILNYTRTSITTFGASLKAYRDRSWILDNFIEVSKASCRDEIEQIIRNDAKVGRDHLIDHVLVPSRTFNVLYMEGVITYEQMEAAEVDEENQTITVRGVKLAGGEYTVKTVSQDYLDQNYEGGYGTIDAEGNIV